MKKKLSPSALIGVFSALMSNLGRFMAHNLDAPRLSRPPKTKYVGCPAYKFDRLTRQRRRAMAKKKFTAELLQFQIPRRVLRLIVRDKVRRLWRVAA